MERSNRRGTGAATEACASRNAAEARVQAATQQDSLELRVELQFALALLGCAFWWAW